MTRGRPTPTVKVNEFRAAYLETGNVSEASRRVGLSIQTGWELAKRADADSEFVSIRKEQHARALEEVRILAQSVARTAHQRYEEPPPEPEERGGGKNVYITIQDNRPAHGKLVIDALRALNYQVQKAEDSVAAPVVTVNVSPIITGESEAKSEPDPEDDGGSSD